MTDPNPFRTYLDSSRAKLRTGVATEQAQRAALERLLQDTGDAQAVNEPSHIECGASHQWAGSSQACCGGKT